MATPLQTISLTIPTFNHKPWVEKGITHVLHLYQGGHLKTFSHLQEQYNLPTRLLFPYLQVKLLMANNLPRKTTANHTNPCQNVTVHLCKANHYHMQRKKKHGTEN
ncbi:Hypothetical predicted protein [Pelobates cultripes]|uniref:Uncharacterized protein n=1 Tax=Pelobates cultripes TaxID=61616 RepID=A0AAD1RYY2_PELCU|nr:Hypothetical predicted protein [Pelobates cultripes]